MALWVCEKCTTAYAVGLPACPQCGSKKYRPDYEEPSAAAAAVSRSPKDTKNQRLDTDED